MSTSGSIYGTTSNKYITPCIDWSLVSQDKVNNTSTVLAILYYKKSSSSTASTRGTLSGYLTINGSSAYYSTRVTLSANDSWVEVCRSQRTVSHGSNGKLTITLSASGAISDTTLSSTDVSGSVTLPDIPRASSISAPTFTLGQSGTISINRADSSFTHTIQYQYGSASGTIATKTGSTSVSWTPPISLASQTPNGTQGSGTLTCYTYSGNTQIGQSSITFKANVPSSVAPSISGISIAEAASGLAEQFGAYVQGKSKLRIKTSASGSYGSSISNCQIKVDGMTYTGTDVTSVAIASSGAVTISAMVTDSRGRTASKTANISVTPYAQPAITALSAHRCSADGTDDPNGDYIYISYAYSISPVGDKNTKSVTISIKPSSGESWNEVKSESAYSASTSFVPQTEYPNDYRYDVRIRIVDYFGEGSAVTQVPSADTIIDILASGDAVAFGEVAEQSNSLTVAADWKTRLRGDVEIKESPLADFVIEQGTSGIWKYRKWASGIAECWGYKKYGDLACNIAFGSMYETKEVDTELAYPTGLFKDLTYHNICSSSTSQVFFVEHISTWGSNGKVGQIWLIRPTSATLLAPALSFHAIGRWK